MPDFPGVCIMIPTYNQAKYIKKAVESALAQDYPNLEIVIADDNSPDNTTEVLQSLISHPKIKYRKNAVNLGRVANYGKCLKEYATSEWVVNLDGDDYYTNKRFISQAIEAIGASGINDTLFYQASHKMMLKQVEIFTFPQMNRHEECMTSEDYFFKFFERNYFSHMSTLYNRKLAVENNFYHANVLSSDIYSFLRLCLLFRDKKVIVSKNIAGVWLQHAHNTSSTTQLKKHWDNFGIYIKLYHLALETGYRKRLCIKWIMSAGYTYTAGYVLKLIGRIRGKI